MIHVTNILLAQIYDTLEAGDIIILIFTYSYIFKISENERWCIFMAVWLEVFQMILISDLFLIKNSLFILQNCV